MKGSAFARTLPSGPGELREQMILDAVRRRDIAPISWVTVPVTFTTSDGREYTAFFNVSADALRVGDTTDSFRATVTHRTAQYIADELGVVLPTPKLSDEIWKNASVRLPSMSQAHKKWVDDGTMANTDRMLEQSKIVDDLVAKAHERDFFARGLIADVGKDWVTTSRLFKPYDRPPHCESGDIRSANYGWHLTEPWMFKSESQPSAINVMQPVGLCHSIKHVDYSQVVRLVRRDVRVCGPGLGSQGCHVFDIRSLASDASLYGLVNHDGPLASMRHPGVPPSCDNRCPADAGDTPVVMGFEVGGPQSCPINCDKFAPPAPDPTATASMGAGAKLLVFGAGAAAGYYGLMFLLPKLS